MKNYIIYNGLHSIEDMNVLIDTLSIPSTNEVIENIEVEGRNGSLTIKHGNYLDRIIPFKITLIRDIHEHIESFIDKVGIRAYVSAHPEMSKPTLIRKFHNDFSWAFVMKYWEILEIPNEHYAAAIAEVGRGHRKTDLMDENLYPTDFDLGNGAKANLALLAAVIRLADELDIASDRNPDLLYDTESMEGMSEKDVFEFSKHEAIHTVDFTEDNIVIIADTDKADIADGVVDATRTVKETLAYCLSVIEARSDIGIDCKTIKLILNENEVEV